MNLNALPHRFEWAPDEAHASSAERHASWARDFAVVGDFESAMDALRDLHAVASEIALTRDGS